MPADPARGSRTRGHHRLSGRVREADGRQPVERGTRRDYRPRPRTPIPQPVSAKFRSHRGGRRTSPAHLGWNVAGPPRRKHRRRRRPGSRRRVRGGHGHGGRNAYRRAPNGGRTRSPCRGRRRSRTRGSARRRRPRDDRFRHRYPRGATKRLPGASRPRVGRVDGPRLGGLCDRRTCRASCGRRERGAIARRRTRPPRHHPRSGWFARGELVPLGRSASPGGRRQCDPPRPHADVGTFRSAGGRAVGGRARRGHLRRAPRTLDAVPGNEIAGRLRLLPVTRVRSRHGRLDAAQSVWRRREQLRAASCLARRCGDLARRFRSRHCRRGQRSRRDVAGCLPRILERHDTTPRLICGARCRLWPAFTTCSRNGPARRRLCARTVLARRRPRRRRGSPISELRFHVRSTRHKAACARRRGGHVHRVRRRGRKSWS